MKSSRPDVGPVEVLEHEDDRCPSRRSARRRCARRRTAGPSPCRARSRAAPAAPARSSAARSSSGTCSATESATFARVVGSSSRLGQAAPAADHLAERPEGDALAVRGRSAAGATRSVSTRPSRYLLNSQARRLLPMPAGPMTETSRARCSRPVAWNRSLSSRSSSSRPTNGASSVSVRLRPPTLGDDAQRPPGRHRRGLALERPARRRPRRRSPRSPRAASPRRPGPCRAARPTGGGRPC